MESNHTKGEWEINFSRETPNALIETKDADICIVDSWYNLEDDDDFEEFKSNCHLIASAPLLLEALQEMIRMYEEVEPAGGWKGVHDQSVSAVNKALNK